MAYYRSYQKSTNYGCLPYIIIIGVFFLIRLIINYPLEGTIIIIVTFVLYKLLKPTYYKSIEKYQIWRFETKLCSHGIEGGLNLNLCDKCENLKKESKLRQQEFDEKLKLKSIDDDKRNEIKFLMREAENDLIKLINKKNASKLEYLISANPYVFEKIIGQMYEELGYKVKQTPKSNDKGKDLVMSKGGKKYIVECKRYNHSNLVGRPEIQKFYAACIEEKVEQGFFITTSDFTSLAKVYPNDIDNKIQLINGISLIQLMNIAYPSTSENDKYYIVCNKCGDIIQFELEGVLEKKCKLKHLVKSNIEEIKNGIFNTASFVYLEPKCPICSSKMKKIKSKYYKNSFFWGCSKYPKCNGLLKKNDNLPSDLVDLY